MGNYRLIQIDFWEDSFIEGLSAKEKYFYLYLLTNPKANVCGIFELTVTAMRHHTKLSIQDINDLIGKLREHKRVKYNADCGEMFVCNWLKYNLNISPKVQVRMVEELKKVKTREFVEDFGNILAKLGYGMDTVGILYEYFIAINININMNKNIYMNINRNINIDNIIGIDVSQPKSIPQPKKPDDIDFDFELKRWKNITKEDVELWKESYPACQLKIELLEMINWIISAGPKGHKKNWRRFITNWLARSQEKGGTIREWKRK